jgi:hypothetical protein
MVQQGFLNDNKSNLERSISEKWLIITYPSSSDAIIDISLQIQKMLGRVRSLTCHVASHSTKGHLPDSQYCQMWLCAHPILLDNKFQSSF